MLSASLAETGISWLFVAGGRVILALQLFHGSWETAGKTEALDCSIMSSTHAWKTHIRCFCREVRCYCDYWWSKRSCNPAASLQTHGPEMRRAVRGPGHLSVALRLLCCVAAPCPSWLDNPGLPQGRQTGRHIPWLLCGLCWPPAPGTESCSQEPVSFWSADVYTVQVCASCGKWGIPKIYCPALFPLFNSYRKQPCSVSTEAGCEDEAAATSSASTLPCGYEAQQC